MLPQAATAALTKCSCVGITWPFIRAECAPFSLPITGTIEQRVIMVWFLSRRAFSAAARGGLLSPKVASAAPGRIFGMHDCGVSPKALP